jgi:phospholipase C
MLRSTSAMTAILLFAVSGCGAPSSRFVPLPAGNYAAVPHGASNDAEVPHGASQPIQHVIILIQENRSFDNLFDGFPGANTTKTGLTHTGREVPLTPITLQTTGKVGGKDIDHTHWGFYTEYHKGKMDGFDLIHFGSTGDKGPAKLYPYAYVERSQTAPYWSLAKAYTLADHMFSTATTGSFVAHQQLIAGTTSIGCTYGLCASLTDWPSAVPWGCDAPAGTTTPVLYSNGTEIANALFPCMTQYPTMANVLDAAHVSWKYYISSAGGPDGDYSGELWNAFDAIKHVRHGADWKHVTSPNTTIFKDLSKGTLPQVAWVVPLIADSDHPASGSDTGPSWVTSVVNAVGKSRYWKHTAIIVLWDDWGGFYDNVKPPQLDYTSLSFRVPAIIVSPYAKKHHVAHKQYEFGSILKFIEETFGTGSLGATDVRARSIDDCFDFTAPASAFQAIAAPYPVEYFLHHRSLPSPKDIIDADGYPG